MRPAVVRLGTLLGTAPAATRAAAAAAVKFPEIADQLLEKGQFPAGRRGCPGHRRDLLAVFQNLVVHRLDYPLVVEVDDVDLLVEHIRVEKSSLRGSPADVIPGLVIVEDADARRRAEDFRNLVFGRAARMNLGKFIRIGQIAALVHGWSAAHQRCSTVNSKGKNERLAYREG